MTEAVVPQERKFARRKFDRRMYLVVLDESPEFLKALRYATRMASVTGGHIGILSVIDVEEVQSWGMIEARLKQEMRSAAEKRIWDVSKIVNDWNGQIPVIFLTEGNKSNVVTDIANDPQNGVGMLVLATAASGGAPGALVTHFSAKGLNSLKVPVVLVPGHLDDIWIDEI